MQPLVSPLVMALEYLYATTMAMLNLLQCALTMPLLSLTLTEAQTMIYGVGIEAWFGQSSPRIRLPSAHSRIKAFIFW